MALLRCECCEALLRVVQKDHVWHAAEVVHRLAHRVAQSCGVQGMLAAFSPREKTDLGRHGELSQQVTRSTCQEAVRGESRVVVGGIQPANTDAQSLFEEFPVGIKPVYPEDNASVSSAHTPSLISVVARTATSMPVAAVVSAMLTG